ncbi:hypothetical protein PN36_22575 [Candidatus Thiomargarita nelsonii]|uniref:Uncharacterized protein n=1 Tax=Candidatus Thiomargarita nelsonii TaxID=1003181 RepID=A0A0A6PHY0_9GAMM|nr:hypothetical protein PN36_22575 [Candidatus Thiomargarita nelsonii]
MDSIQLIVTGNMEKLVLHKALGNNFPNIAFWEPIQSQGFTSVDISLIPPDLIGEEREVDELVTALFNEIERRKHADMIIVIDDLETVNFHQPEVVVKYFRGAVNTYMKNHHLTQRVLKKLREDCSFHLLVPMAETYFFL